ncbi:MarR family transcriptional regulator [Olsenella sp. Marseille-P4559]|uniref:MarR family transcriptional regulator n=1 Tax=Olsenella sp. Marseille-P4559 TaxID=2364795 RepID=UPI00103148BD|nr:MarR family transcriptional regulator [Olsenella sp. Marseille-P4559]
MEDVLNQLAEYMERQEVLSRLTESEGLHGYSYSEIHTIRAIGDLPEPNVSSIAERMGMTRGAISKIAKRLQADGLAESYRLEGNRQKVLYRLTDAGRVLYDEHERRHALWLERDRRFVGGRNAAEVSAVQRFLADYNDYLKRKIEELGG